MKILKINIYWGLSIILKYINVFEQLLEKNLYDKIFVSINKSSFDDLRAGFNIGFYKKYYDFLEFLVSNNSNIVVVDDQSFVCMEADKISDDIHPRFQIINKLTEGVALYN